MRLLHAKHLDFHEFDGSRIPEYAILSHRWEEGEVTHQDMQGPLSRLSAKAGFTKVQRCCIQALKDGYDYVWADTCCIRNVAQLTTPYESGGGCRQKRWALKFQTSEDVR
jgi:hypothetical protein